ncbi:uncharacterized protein N7484_003158 [Penicillium longicatenatum]|uniref:uncharacterized protein n=1 Tax=Penicillium longicatenatum TaxID=1561947 RepID=UPI0025488DD4|nr:uncharacterized protein N7484_003158 [Penicillium longicatenatum]KAJ5649435.1 hypothetical protein N7484_003158 [Penicillium longicatenatum]
MATTTKDLETAGKLGAARIGSFRFGELSQLSFEGSDIYRSRAFRQSQINRLIHRFEHEIDNHSRDFPIGNALKDALSMDDEMPLSRAIATVPQMIAMLLDKTELIENIESTDVRMPLVEGEGLSWVRRSMGQT